MVPKTIVIEPNSYNPIEHVWEILEQQNSALLDSLETVQKYIESMIRKGSPSLLNITDTPYEIGVKVGKEEMKQYELALETEQS